MNVKLKQISQRYKDIIFGYIRKLPYIDTSNLSKDIVNIILVYYYMHFKFDTKNCSTYLKFSNDDTTVITNKTSLRTKRKPTVLFESLIENISLCNIHFKLNSKENKIHCFVGYAISKDGIKNFNQGLGY